MKKATNYKDEELTESLVILLERICDLSMRGYAKEVEKETKAFYNSIPIDNRKKVFLKLKDHILHSEGWFLEDLVFFMRVFKVKKVSIEVDKCSTWFGRPSTKVPAKK